MQEQKITLPLLGALQASPEKAAEIRQKVTRIGEQPEYQAEIVAFVRNSGGIAYALRRKEEYIGRTISALDVLPEGEGRQALVDLAGRVAQRKS